MKIPKIHINTHGDGNVLLTIDPPDREKRAGMDIVAVIDVSGSMQVEASMKDEKGDVEQHGLSILDVVKHSMKTIIKTMKPDDRLAIVTFSTEAKVIFGLIPMNERGNKRALREVKKLEVETQTNLWDGLYQGMEIFRKAKTRKNQAHLILFTDGLPNVVPPRGHIHMVEKYKKDNPNLNATLHFVGFGYSLDSKLLEDLARSGNGLYNYIPDSSFVGTVFVNAISNIFSTLSSNLSLTLEPMNGASMDGVLGEYEMKGNTIQPGCLFFGQRKDIMLKMKFPKEKLAFLRVKMTYDIPLKEEPMEVVVEGGEFTEIADVEVEKLRVCAVESIRKALHHAMNRNDLKAAQGIIDEMIEMIEKSRVKGNEYVKGLLKDLNGQVSLSLSRKEWFERWGGHYLRSLLGAHLHQVCNNFKDPGVQSFGGKLFQKLRDEGEEVFSKLPPPKATPPKNPFAGTNLAHLWQPPQKARPARQNFSMRRYYNVGGGCISGSCEARMGDGSKKLVKDIRKGDIVRSSGGKNAKVICTVKTLCENGKMKMVQLDGGLTLTPYHPVLAEGEWRFPTEIGEEKEMLMGSVYDFVLEKHHSMIINGMEVVSFGHGKKGSVVEHQYFGTKKIVQDLEKLEGWKNGFITLGSKALKRDKVSNLVVGIDRQFEVC